MIKRINALLHFYRWTDAWTYVRHLQVSKAAPTKAMSMIQAPRVAHHVLQMDGADSCIVSRRLTGSAELQMANKGPTRQARALTVAEVKRLHDVTTNQFAALKQRVLASHL